MKKIICFMGLCASLTALDASAAVIDFEDFTFPNDGVISQTIVNGYQGLNWAMDVAGDTFLGGAAAGTYAGWTGNTSSSIQALSGEKINLFSAFFASSSSTLSLGVEGFNGATSVFSTTLNLTNTLTQFTFNSSLDITNLVFSQTGAAFLIDDIVLNTGAITPPGGGGGEGSPVPAPGIAALLLAGLLGAGFSTRKPAVVAA